ncbi:MAG: pantoate--beta-alanine ligase [Pseudomonadota bacterium]
MQIVQSIEELRSKLRQWKREEQRVALVPTMGHLHQGHVSLIERAQASADKVVASIYVNPSQFDRPDDLGNYPRTLESDIEQLKAVSVDMLFAPTDAIIYPGGHSNKTRIDIPGMTNILCGAHRPGHFIGVATIVCKLFNLVQPNIAVFGKKDFQQLMIIRQMTSDLNLPVEIVGAPTWRENSGLAMSSRNSYLNADEFEKASKIYQCLCECAQAMLDGNRHFQELESRAISQLNDAGFESDYVSIRRAIDLTTPTDLDEPESLVVLAAAFLGDARLIDNLQIRDYSRSGNIARAAARASEIVQSV